MLENKPIQEPTAEQLRAQEVAPVLKFYDEDIFVTVSMFDADNPDEEYLVGNIDLVKAADQVPENQKQMILSMIGSLHLQFSDAQVMLLAYQQDPELQASLAERGYIIDQVMLDMEDGKSDMAVVVKKLPKDHTEQEQAVETKLVTMTNTCGFCNKEVVVEREMPIPKTKTEKGKKGKPARKYRDYVLNVPCDCIYTRADGSTVHPEVQVWKREYIDEE
jgi:hypothetical protein